MRRIQEFEDEHEREAAGLTNYQDYRRPLTDFVEPFLESLSCSETRVGLLRMRLRRAFRLLRLDVLADLDDFAEIEKRLLRLEGRGFTRKTLVEGFQATLKQLSRYLAGRRETETDHLAPWPRLKVGERSSGRRALTPEEMARALAASDCLDAICMRKHPMRPVWTALLVAAPRVSALAALEVPDFDRVEGRLITEGCGNKRAGAGALDDRTTTEIATYLGKRRLGPLFLSPQGARILRCNSLDQWRAAVSLAAVDLEWPKREARDLRTTYLVHYALSHKRVCVAMGGPLTGLHRPGPNTRASRKREADRIRRIADAIRPAWLERTRGHGGRMIDQHCLRMTHRTWALAAGVPEVLIDCQLGHTSPAGDAALHAAWSMVGRTRYTDMDFLTLDARRSAAAVRDLLDRAEAELGDILDQGESALRVPRSKGRLGVEFLA
jgi:hypothetical protein